MNCQRDRGFHRLVGRQELRDHRTIYVLNIENKDISITFTLTILKRAPAFQKFGTYSASDVGLFDNSKLAMYCRRLIA